QTIAGISSAPSPSLMVTFDHTAPSAIINQAAMQSDPTRFSPVNYTAVFSEKVSGPGLVSLQGSTANVGNAFFSNNSVDGITWNIAVSGVTSNGQNVVASIPAGYKDLAGNSGSASTSTDNAVVLDNVRPSVTI